MAFLDLAAGNGALKEWYDAQKVQNLAYSNNPQFAMIAKEEDVGGKYYPQPTIYEVNQGRSAVFATAQANQTAAQIAEFMVVRKRDYDVATIDNETMESAASDQGAFLRFATLLIDAAIQGATISCASAMFRSGTGTIGQISSIAAGVITLVNPADLTQFGINQTLQANSSDGGVPRAALGWVINRSIRNGTITVSNTGPGGVAGTPTGWSSNDFLLVQGDVNAKISGFPAWLPLTDPTSTDNFYAVNRSVDYRLFGVNYDGSGQPIEEAVIDHSLLLGREGAMVDCGPTNYQSYSAILKALGTRREYIELEGPGKIGFKALVIDGATGPIHVYFDRSCQAQTMFLLQDSTWKLISLGSVPKILRYEDRVEMLRVFNADAAEARIAYYANLVTNAPGRNGQLKLPS